MTPYFNFKYISTQPGEPLLKSLTNFLANCRFHSFLRVTHGTLLPWTTHVNMYIQSRVRVTEKHDPPFLPPNNYMVETTPPPQKMIS